MKKNKFTIVLLIAAIMFAAILVIGCNAGCPGMGSCSWDDKKEEGSVCVDQKTLDYYNLLGDIYDEEEPTEEDLIKIMRLMNDLCGVVTSEGDAKCDC